jgi:geranylgeranyl pyrophosphate synthase
MTLPVIYAFEHASPGECSRLASIWRTDAPEHGQVAEAVALIEKLGGRDYTRDQAREHRDRALAELEAAGVVDAEALESLRAIIVGVIKA